MALQQSSPVKIKNKRILFCFLFCEQDKSETVRHLASQIIPIKAVEYAKSTWALYYSLCISSPRFPKKLYNFPLCNDIHFSYIWKNQIKSLWLICHISWHPHRSITLKNGRSLVCTSLMRSRKSILYRKKDRRNKRRSVFNAWIACYNTVSPTTFCARDHSYLRVE